MTRRVAKGRSQVYLIRGADGTYYAGWTNNLERRLQLHNAGRGAKYLRGRRPVEVVYVKTYRDRGEALRAEHELKRLTRRQKEALIQASPVGPRRRVAGQEPEGVSGMSWHAVLSVSRW